MGVCWIRSSSFGSRVICLFPKSGLFIWFQPIWSGVGVNADHWKICKTGRLGSILKKQRPQLCSEGAKTSEIVFVFLKNGLKHCEPVGLRWNKPVWVESAKVKILVWADVAVKCDKVWWDGGYMAVNTDVAVNCDKVWWRGGQRWRGYIDVTVNRNCNRMMCRLTWLWHVALRAYVAKTRGRHIGWRGCDTWCLGLMWQKHMAGKMAVWWWCEAKNYLLWLAFEHKSNTWIIAVCATKLHTISLIYSTFFIFIKTVAHEIWAQTAVRVIWEVSGQTLGGTWMVWWDDFNGVLTVFVRWML